MAMTKTETAAIKNVIKRLKEPNCGCSNGFDADDLVKLANSAGIEAVSRSYLDSWIIPALELLLPGDKRNPDLAARLAGK